eukprot:1479224-Pleurochrysis_carterae.AAC.1
MSARLSCLSCRLGALRSSPSSRRTSSFPRRMQTKLRSSSFVRVAHLRWSTRSGNGFVATRG